METRILDTSIWRNADFRALDDKSARIVLYLLTNDQIPVLPAYKMPLDEIAFYTGTTIQKITEILPELPKFGIFYEEGYFIVTNKYTRADYMGGQNEAKRQRLLSELPENLREWFNEIGKLSQIMPIRWSSNAHAMPMPCSSDAQGMALKIRNKKSETNNQKLETRNQKPRDIDIFINRFNELFGSSFQVTEGRVKKLGLRLGKFTLSQILDALLALSESKWHRGDNDRGWKADPDFLLRSDEAIDKWLNSGSKQVTRESTDPLVRASRESLSK